MTELAVWHLVVRLVRHVAVPGWTWKVGLRSSCSSMTSLEVRTVTPRSMKGVDWV